MSSEQQYLMHFFLIFLFVCLGAPAVEGMVSALCVFLIVNLNLTYHGRRFYALLMLQKERAASRQREGRTDNRKLGIKFLSKSTTRPIYRRLSADSVIIL